jgi:hypothetical protein
MPDGAVGPGLATLFTGVRGRAILRASLRGGSEKFAKKASRLVHLYDVTIVTTVLGCPAKRAEGYPWWGRGFDLRPARMGARGAREPAAQPATATRKQGGLARASGWMGGGSRCGSYLAGVDANEETKRPGKDILAGGGRWRCDDAGAGAGRRRVADRSTTGRGPGRRSPQLRVRDDRRPRRALDAGPPRHTHPRGLERRDLQQRLRHLLVVLPEPRHHPARPVPPQPRHRGQQPGHRRRREEVPPARAGPVDGGHMAKRRRLPN